MAAKKKTRRMKKQVRRTLGAIFLASAITVAAIPVDSRPGGVASADTTRATDFKVTISRNATTRKAEMGADSTVPTMDTLIPEVTAKDTIYSTIADEQGTVYKFAYKKVTQSGGSSAAGDNEGDWVAILLQVNKGNSLDGNLLVIPGVVDAYIQPTGNLGSEGGYMAASMSGEPLYYERLTERTREVPKVVNGVVQKDNDGNTIYEDETYYTGEIKECYATDPIWKNMFDNGRLRLSDFFYKDDNAQKVGSPGGAQYVDADGKLQDQTYDGYARSGDNELHQWITAGKVRYIGNQYLTTDKNGRLTVGDDGNYLTAATAGNGLFAGSGNIGTVQISDNLIGVGNYAFYNCTGLGSVTFGNGLRVIGNWAFAGCTRMTSVNVPELSSLGQIGDHAFYRCSSLPSITIPHGVSYIGDYAFAECPVLGSVEMCDFLEGPSGSVLTLLGWSVFENCSVLRSLTLPDSTSYAETEIDISLVKGCKNLHSITCRNENLTFVAKDGYSFDEFKAMLGEGTQVNGEFYFEGIGGSKLYTFARDNCFAFSYIRYNSETLKYEKLNEYELTVQEDPNDEETKATYVVTSGNKLKSVVLGDNVTKLEIPNKIGPNSIKALDNYVFENRCSLKLVTIPADLESIGEAAFKGCHNLENVIFKTNKVAIGKDAFKTQDYTGTNHTCTTGVETDTDNLPVKKLHFIGEISPSSTPYLYAMNADNNYNNGGQTRSYITYYSGWPTNLEVEFHYDKDLEPNHGYSELVNFPAYSELASYAEVDAVTKEPKYAYMTEAYRKAAQDALNGGNLTEDQEDFIDSALNIKIPEGIQAIRDGLFWEKDNKDNGRAKTVTLSGIDVIETEDFHQVDETGKLLYYKTDANGEIISPQETTTEDVSNGTRNLPIGCDGLIEISVIGNTAVIEDDAFANLDNLAKVEITGGVTTIGDYAFEDCKNLSNVALSGTVSNLGLCPFKNCPELSNVTFLGDDYYTCANSIIFNADKTKIIECLSGKGFLVSAEEVKGVTDIAPEAFSGTKVKEVDLTSSSIKSVPTRAFANTENLRTVKLPATCVQISDYAFDNSAFDRLEMSQNLNMLGQNPFAGMVNNPEEVLFVCPEESYMHDYALLNHFQWLDQPPVVYCTVSFYDWDETLTKNVWVKDLDVLQGTKVPTEDIPNPKGKAGYVFAGWDPDCGEEVIYDNPTRFDAQYTEKQGPTVTFKDWDGRTIKTVTVAEGQKVELPRDPERDGYVFKEWIGREAANDEKTVSISDPITVDTIFTASYEAVKSGLIFIRFVDNDTGELIDSRWAEPGTPVNAPAAPAKENYTFVTWSPSDLSNLTEDTTVRAIYVPGSNGNGSNGNGGNGNGSDGNGGNGNGSDGNGGNGNGGGNGGNGSGTDNNVTTYTLTVINGSGSGSYKAGDQPIIVANEPQAGQEFSTWSVDPDDVKIVSKVLSATVLTMPAGNVTVTAHYKAKTTSTTGGGTTGTTTGTRPNGTTGVVSNGTTVVIDKNGLSNTGVVSATVHGSSDNFTIKVTESSAAAEAVLRALQAEYGSLDNIKYFPMDISLYDAAGTKKITDTTGLKISITLPLPDSLITYAGNNKVAGVVNDRLDKLSPKFTTIDGVACVTFDAEHFSPYVIYVETNNLTAGASYDSTPKTGDGIHPKWFLSVGLACMSAVMFMKKDKRTAKVKAA